MFRIHKKPKPRFMLKRLIYKPVHNKKMEDYESGFSFPEVLRVRYEDFIL